MLTLSNHFIYVINYAKSFRQIILFKLYTDPRVKNTAIKQQKNVVMSLWS